MNKEDLYIYNGILFNHKKQGNSVIYNNTNDFEGIMLSEISQTEKDKYHMISLICGILGGGKKIQAHRYREQSWRLYSQ